MAALVRRPAGSAGSADEEIYTILLIIATGFLLIATVLLAVQFQMFYGLGSLFQSVPGL